MVGPVTSVSVVILITRDDLFIGRNCKEFRGGIGEADEGGTSLNFRTLLLQNYAKMFLPV